MSWCLLIMAACWGFAEGWLQSLLHNMRGLFYSEDLVPGKYDHKPWWIVRLMVLSCYGVLVVGEVESWTEYIGPAMILYGSSAAVLDVVMNLNVRGWPWYHLGSTGWWDPFVVRIFDGFGEDEMRRMFVFATAFDVVVAIVGMVIFG